MTRYTDIGRVPGAWRDSRIASAASESLRTRGYYDPSQHGPGGSVGGLGSGAALIDVFVTPANQAEVAQLSRQASSLRSRLSGYNARAAAGASGSGYTSLAEEGRQLRAEVAAYNARVEALASSAPPPPSGYIGGGGRTRGMPSLTTPPAPVGPETVGGLGALVVLPASVSQRQEAFAAVEFDAAGMKVFRDVTRIPLDWLHVTRFPSTSRVRLDFGPVFAGRALNFIAKNADTGEVLATTEGGSTTTFLWVPELPAGTRVAVEFTATDYRPWGAEKAPVQSGSAHLFTFVAGATVGASQVDLYAQPDAHPELLSTTLAEVPAASTLRPRAILVNEATVEALKAAGVDPSGIRVESNQMLSIGGVLPKGWRFAWKNLDTQSVSFDDLQHSDNSTGAHMGSESGHYQQRFLAWVCTPNGDLPLLLLHGFRERTTLGELMA